MSVLYIAIPVALIISATAIIAFAKQVQDGQYDDLETPAHRILFDDERTSKSNQDDTGR